MVVAVAEVEGVEADAEVEGPRVVPEIDTDEEDGRKVSRVCSVPEDVEGPVEGGGDTTGVDERDKEGLKMCRALSIDCLTRNLFLFEQSLQSNCPQ